MGDDEGEAQHAGQQHVQRPRGGAAPVGGGCVCERGARCGQLVVARGCLRIVGLQQRVVLDRTAEEIYQHLTLLSRHLICMRVPPLLHAPVIHRGTHVLAPSLRQGTAPESGTLGAEEHIMQLNTENARCGHSGCCLSSARVHSACACA